jgi:hypothetical protein
VQTVVIIRVGSLQFGTDVRTDLFGPGSNFLTRTLSAQTSADMELYACSMMLAAVKTTG